MSVILDALRSQKEEGKKESPTPSDEGLFLGKSGFLKKESKRFPKRAIFLSILLFAAVGGGVFFFAWKSSKPSRPIAEVAEEKSPTIPISPPLETDVAKETDISKARLLFQSGDLNGSLKLFEQALLQNPDDVFLHNDLGLVYLKKELYSSAEEHFKKALEKNQACAECLNNFGYLKTVLGQNVEAQKYLQKAISINPNYADPYFNLGVLYEKNGDILQSVKAFQNFLDLKPQVSAEVVSELKEHLKELTGQ